MLILRTTQKRLRLTLQALAIAVLLPAAAQVAQAAPKATKKSAKAVATAPAAKSATKSRRTKTAKRHSVVSVAAQKPSFGSLYGLHATSDPLDLKSSVAYVLDPETQEVLFSKNAQAVLPIASITKLMTALVLTEANLPLDEMITVTQDDVDTEKNSGSRLRVGTRLSREEMLHLALMSSENRAAHALGRTYPGGLDTFVAKMNAKARELGMVNTNFVEPTGLSSKNQSSAPDLATLVAAAGQVPLIRELSTSLEYEVEVGRKELTYRNTNGLVRSPSWTIDVQKTGYIAEAGRCLVMQAQLAGRKLIMIFLDSAGKYSRIGDAERVRRWITENAPAASAAPTAQVDAELQS